VSDAHSVVNDRSGSSIFAFSASPGAGSAAGVRSRSARSTVWVTSCSHSAAVSAGATVTPASVDPGGAGFVGRVGVPDPPEQAAANTSQAIVLTVHRC
jgi:hypothetical protein